MVKNAILTPKINLFFIALFYIFNRLVWSDPSFSFSLYNTPHPLKIVSYGTCMPPLPLPCIFFFDKNALQYYNALDILGGKDHENNNRIVY